MIILYKSFFVPSCSGPWEFDASEPHHPGPLPKFYMGFNKGKKQKQKQKPAIYFLAGQIKLSHDPHVNFITKVGRRTRRKKKILYCSQSKKMNDKWLSLPDCQVEFLEYVSL